MKCRPYACFVAGWLVVLVLSAGCNLRSSKFTERADPAATGDNLLSVQDMQSDLDTLWAAIKEVHPGYGIYASSDSLHTKYKEVRSSILEPLPENEFITHIYSFFVCIGMRAYSVAAFRKLRARQRTTNRSIAISGAGTRTESLDNKQENWKTGNRGWDHQHERSSCFNDHTQKVIHCIMVMDTSALLEDLFFIEYDGFSDAAVNIIIGSLLSDVST